MAYVNNHYVPQGILRRFGEKMHIYDLSKRSLRLNEKTENIFSCYKLYSENLETKFGLIETQFINLIDKILKQENKIPLKRHQIWLIKRFLLISMYRVGSAKDTIKAEINLCEKLAMTYPQLFPFTEKIVENESIDQRWERELGVLLECENLVQMAKHPDVTKVIYRWMQVFNVGYLAFWDSKDSEENFIVTDIGMTSENEIGWSEASGNVRKLFYLMDRMKNETNEDKKGKYLNFLTNQIFFHENFMVFSISKTRTIALINPFFRMYYENDNFGLEIPKLEVSLISDDLFEKNKAIYKEKDLTKKTFYEEQDDFVYEIKRLNLRDVIYINMLMLDRINNYVGIADLNKVRRSIFNYNKLEFKRNNFDELFIQIEKQI